MASVIFFSACLGVQAVILALVSIPRTNAWLREKLGINDGSWYQKEKKDG